MKIMLSKLYSSAITSSLYNCIFSWTAKLLFPMKNTTPQQEAKCQSGLKTLVHSQLKPIPRILHRFETMESEPSSPPPPSLSWLWSQSSPPLRPTALIGDVIGAESGDWMTSNFEEVFLAAANVDVEPRKASYKERRSKTKRELPPPITALRENGKMPWKFKMECSDDDGRLIVTAVRERRFDDIEARREDGKLTMTTFVDNYFCEECGYSVYGEDGDFEFNEEFECIDEEEEECGFEFEFEFEAEFADDGGSKESEQCGDDDTDLRECVTYDDGGPGFGPPGLIHYSDSFPNIYLGQPASTSFRPMTPVM